MKDAGPVLTDIARVIEHIRSAVAGASLADYASNWMLKHAVERGVEIISEASRRLPESAKAQHPEIPWRRIAGIGNVLRHSYDSIVDQVVYELATRELATLHAAIRAIQASLDKPPK